MKKGFTYLTIAALGLTALAAPILAAARPRSEHLHVQRVIPVATTYQGHSQALKIPVYTEISASKTPQCAKYARHVAKDVFGKTYQPDDAWDLQYKNKVVAQVSRRTTLEKLADRGILRPGMMVGIYNPRSDFNSGRDEKGKPREYTHVIVYLGDDPKTSEPLFADQFGQDTRVKTEKQLKRTGLVPREILNSKN
jgi:hypothetical protein